MDVPELTPEEIQARVLHRDGLMLVIDKPAGLPVHRGPKGGANLESSFDALRFGLPRVHAAAQGWPIVGDNIYGNGPRFGEPHLHLHSREIVIPISKNREAVRVTAPAPEHMRERLMACGWRGQ